jgi:hypothetical protein
MIEESRNQKAEIRNRDRFGRDIRISAFCFLLSVFMKRFIEWDSIDVRVDGGKINAMARQIVAQDPMIERLELKFANGLLRVEGSVRKFISVPFSVEIREMRAKG